MSIDQWSTTAANNASGVTNVNWAEGQAPSTVNDSARNMMADVAAWYGQAKIPEYLTGTAGTNTVTATGPTSLAAYAAGQRFTFIPANSNTGAATLNVTGASALGAKSIFLNGAALVGYELRKNCPVAVLYDGTQFNIISGSHGGDGIPIGHESNRYFATAPNGHLLCDGTAVSRTTYADLYAVLSTTYGVGDGVTTFNLPSVARRVSVGSGGAGTATLANTVGSTGGEETHLLTGAESGTSAHPHTSSTVVHTSDQGGAAGTARTASPGTNTGAGAVNTDYTDNLVTTTTSNSVAANASSAHNNMQPSVVVYKCIKY